MRASRWLTALGVVTLTGATVSVARGGGANDRGSGPEIPDSAHEPLSSTQPLEHPTTALAGPEISEPTPGGRLQLETEPRRTESGAVAAAVRYLEATEDAVLLSPPEARAKQAAMATAEFADEFGAQAEQRMVELEAAVPGGITLRVAPIETRSASMGDDWLVSIWYVSAITLNAESVVDDWRTVTYRMRWEGSAWKIAAFDSKRGPTPGRGEQPSSEPVDQFELLLEEFSDTELT